MRKQYPAASHAFQSDVKLMILKIDMQKELENLQKEEANTKKKI